MDEDKEITFQEALRMLRGETEIQNSPLNTLSLDYNDNAQHHSKPRGGIEEHTQDYETDQSMNQQQPRMGQYSTPENQSVPKSADPAALSIPQTDKQTHQTQRAGPQNFSHISGIGPSDLDHSEDSLPANQQVFQTVPFKSDNTDMGMNRPESDSNFHTNDDLTLTPDELRKYQIEPTQNAGSEQIVRLEEPIKESESNNTTEGLIVPKDVFTLEVQTQDGTNEFTAKNIRETSRTGIGAKVASFFERVQNSLNRFYRRNKYHLKMLLYSVLLLLWAVYIAVALYMNPKRALTIIIITFVITFLGVYHVMQGALKRFANFIIVRPVSKVTGLLGQRTSYIKWVFGLLILIGFIILVAVDIGPKPRQLTSLAGMITLILFTLITSKNPSKVRVRPVLWGLILQFVLGFVLLRWHPGYLAVKFLGDQVTMFLGYTDEGSKFVFGENYMMHPIAMKVLPTVVFFSSVVQMLFYLGIMQAVIQRLAWVLQYTMQTTAVESLNAAGNIFFSSTESAVILRPYISKLTLSELHAVMVGGFATTAGFVLALYTSLGAPAEHLITASFMSAPAALAIAKLNYPETQQSTTETEDDVKLEISFGRNLIEAASNGAISSIKLVAYVVVNLISFVALIAFLNATLSFLGGAVGIPQLSFELICSYFFYPLTILMGTDPQDALKLGSLLGTKVFVSEYISYGYMGNWKKEGLLTERSVMIASYALCGFSSIVTVGIIIAVLVALDPGRRADVSGMAMRALVNGNVACFLTACVAGMLKGSG